MEAYGDAMYEEYQAIIARCKESNLDDDRIYMPVGGKYSDDISHIHIKHEEKIIILNSEPFKSKANNITNMV